MANGDILTNNGKLIILNRAFKATPDYTTLSKFKIGVSNGTPLITDTDLDNTVPISGTETVDDCETADWNDSADMTTALDATNYKIGSNGLTLEKDGTASATASTSKTTTSVDFTSKDLSVWLYIADQTTLDSFATSSCVTLRLGSDSSNYYEWVFDKSELSTGWNLLDHLTSSNADTTTGSPTIAACDYSYIAITASAAGETWAADKVTMDDWKVISSDDYTKTFISGYPSFDTTNYEVEIRGQLLTTEANGYSINGFGLVNTDATVLMGTESTFTANSKGNTDQFTFIQTLRML